MPSPSDVGSGGGERLRCRLIQRLSERTEGTRLGGPLLLAGSRYLSSVVGPLVSLVLVRYLGPEDYGVYVSAVATTSLFAILCDLGLQQAALEAAAGGRYPLSVVLRGMLLLGGAQTLVAYAAMSTWVLLGGYEAPIVRVALYSGLGYLQLPLLAAVIVGLQTKAQYGRIALWNSAVSTARWVGTLAAILADAGIYSVVLWPIALIWVVTAGMLIRERELVGLTQGGRPSARRIPLRSLFGRSWRFGMAGVMYQVYHQSDTVLLSLLRNPLEVGFYGAAFRVIGLVNNLPAIVFNQVLYPKYFRWFVAAPAKIERYYHITSKWMFVMGVMAATAVSLFSAEIMGLVYGAPQEVASKYLLIMAWTVPFRYVAASAGALLTTGRQINRKLRIQTAIAFFNIGLNAALIPLYGAVASATLMVMTDIGLFFLYSHAVRRAQATSPWSQPAVARLGVALLVALVVLTLVTGGQTLRLRVGAGLVAVVAAALYGWGTVDTTERDEMRRLLGSKG